MSDHPSWYAPLQRAARARNIDIDSLNIVPSNPREESEIADWIRVNLTQSEPLTSEELTIWKALQKDKKHQHRPGDVDDRVISLVPLTHDALEEAIKTLESSTQNLQAQTRVLETQQRLLSDFHDKHGAVGHYVDPLQFHTASSRQEAQSQQLKIMNAEVSADIHERLRASQEKVDRLARAATSITTERLKTDDRVLEHLETTASSLATHEDHASSTDLAGRTRSLLAALQRTTVLAVKARLDRIYLEELEAGGARVDSRGDASPSVSVADQIEQTQSDLQSLYAEIDDVAAMLVQNEHGAKLRAVEHELSLQSTDRAARDVREITGKLESIAESSARLAQRYELLQAHRIALDQINQELVLLKTRPETALHPGSSSATRSHAGHRIDPTDHTASPPVTPKLNALLRHLNIDTTPSNAKGTAAKRTTAAALDAQSQATGREIQDLVRDVTSTVEHAAFSAQNHLDTLECTDSQACLAEAAKRIGELDDHIAAVKGEVEEETAVGAGQGGSVAAAERFVERERSR